MSTKIELRITLKPEALEGGYTRYTTDELPGFRILCEPRENPFPLIDRAIHKFMPAWLTASMGNASMKELRIIASPKDIMGTPATILMEADIEQTAA